MVCSDKWKIDKIDKLFICLLLIFICLFEFCNTFVFADESEEVSVGFLNDTVLSWESTLKYTSGYYTYYFEIEDGFTYDVLLSSDVSDENIRTAFSNSISVGSTIYNYAVVPNNYHIVINSDDYDYFYFDFGPQSVDSDPELFHYTITKHKNNSFNSAIDGLVDNVGVENIWSIFDISVNYILVVVLFAIGLFIIFSFIKKGSRGKSGF